MDSGSVREVSTVQPIPGILELSRKYGLKAYHLCMCFQHMQVANVRVSNEGQDRKKWIVKRVCSCITVVIGEL